MLETRFPPVEVAIKIGLSLGIGLLVGFEREWAQKDVGVRTFTITSLLGMLSALAGTSFSLASLAGVFLVIAFANIRSLLANLSLETTTSVALIVTFVLGVLIGQGHLFTPVASSIIVTMLLAWKAELHRFAGGLSPDEVRGAVLLGLLGFVIYPILPDRFIDPWQLLNPRETWTIVLTLAGIGFVNYVLLRVYSAKGLYYTAVLGGLVNSTATVAELSTYMSGRQELVTAAAVPLVLLTVASMAIRNLGILALFAPRAASQAIGPLVAMALAALFFVWRYQTKAHLPAVDLKFSSPVSLKRILSFGMLFLAIEAAGSIGERFFGKLGFLIVSLFGGLVSSASTTAAAASLFAHGRLSPESTNIATVVTTAASAMINIPLVYRQTKRTGVAVTLGIITIVLGLIAFGVILAGQEIPLRAPR